MQLVIKDQLFDDILQGKADRIERRMISRNASALRWAGLIDSNGAPTDKLGEVLVCNSYPYHTGKAATCVMYCTLTIEADDSGMDIYVLHVKSVCHISENKAKTLNPLMLSDSALINWYFEKEENMTKTDLIRALGNALDADPDSKSLRAMAKSCIEYVEESSDAEIGRRISNVLMSSSLK